MNTTNTSMYILPVNSSCIASKLERGDVSGGSIDESFSPAVKGASGNEGASMESTAARVDASKKEVKLLCVDGAIDYASAGVSHVEFITRSISPTNPEPKLYHSDRSDYDYDEANDDSMEGESTPREKSTTPRERNIDSPDSQGTPLSPFSPVTFYPPSKANKGRHGETPVTPEAKSTLPGPDLGMCKLLVNIPLREN